MTSKLDFIPFKQPTALNYAGGRLGFTPGLHSHALTQNRVNPLLQAGSSSPSPGVFLTEGVLGKNFIVQPILCHDVR